jgi:hypothetical protein
MARSRGRYHGQTIRRTQSDAPTAKASPGGSAVQLDCGHAVIFPNRYAPKLGEETYCRECNTMSIATSVLKEIRMRCTECGYGRLFGQAMMTAESKAISHGLRLNHTVAIYRGDDVIKLIHEHDNQNTLSDVPPF